MGGRVVRRVVAGLVVVAGCVVRCVPVAGCVVVRCVPVAGYVVVRRVPVAGYVVVAGCGFVEPEPPVILTSAHP